MDIAKLLGRFGHADPGPRPDTWIFSSSAMLFHDRVWVARLAAPDYDRLEADRRAVSAVRALGVVDGPVPDGAVPPGQREVLVVSAAELQRNLAGIDWWVETQRANQAGDGWEGVTLPWLAEDSDGRALDPIAHVMAWMREPERDGLFVIGPKTLTDLFRHRLKHRVAAAGDLPALWAADDLELAGDAAIGFIAIDDEAMPMVTVEAIRERRALVFADRSRASLAENLGLESIDLVELDERLIDWLAARLEPASRDRLRSAAGASDDLRRLLCESRGYPHVVRAVDEVLAPHAVEPIDPTPALVLEIVRRVLGQPIETFRFDDLAELEDVAYADFLGAASDTYFSIGYSVPVGVRAWVEDAASRPRFINELARNCLAAMKVAREAWLGSTELLEQRRFPLDMQYHLRELLPPTVARRWRP